MEEALKEACKAFEKGEVPIGAIIVKDNGIIARAHNLTETLQDPTAHAEIIAIREASKGLKKWRLKDTTLYVTIEPCPMCAGAILQARISNVVFGANEEKSGAVNSVLDILDNPKLNHRPLIFSGVLEGECKELMQTFFKRARSNC